MEDKARVTDDFIILFTYKPLSKLACLPTAYSTRPQHRGTNLRPLGLVTNLGVVDVPDLQWTCATCILADAKTQI